MKNLYSTPLRYKNFAGVEKNVTLYFHLTPRELADWMLENMDVAERVRRALGEIDVENLDEDADATTEQKSAMLSLVRVLAELSNGHPSDDNEYFDKSGLGKFVHSAAYDAFRLFLFEHPKELRTFIETLLPEESVMEFTRVIHGSANAVTEKTPQNRRRSREDILAELKSLDGEG